MLQTRTLDNLLHLAAHAQEHVMIRALVIAFVLALSFTVATPFVRSMNDTASRAEKVTAASGTLRDAQIELQTAGPSKQTAPK